MSALVGHYNANSTIFQRFGSHAVLGLSQDIGDRTDAPKNVLERIGDAGLWIVEGLPKKIKVLCTDPRVVTVALTAFALVATSFAFYPIATWTLACDAIALLPQVPLWAVRFGSYILTVSVILSASCRAQGRFWNGELMNRFYGAQE
jgi:hypothetical protein